MYCSTRTKGFDLHLTDVSALGFHRTTLCAWCPGQSETLQQANSVQQALIIPPLYRYCHRRESLHCAAPICLARPNFSLRLLMNESTVIHWLWYFFRSILSVNCEVLLCSPRNILPAFVPVQYCQNTCSKVDNILSFSAVLCCSSEHRDSKLMYYIAQLV